MGAQDQRVMAAIGDFVSQAQKIVDEYRDRHFPTLARTVLTVEPGKKYARVVSDNGVSRSVYCFVDMGNGDVLKAASWRSPSKHPRGNVYDQNPTAGVGPYGANYIR